MRGDGEPDDALALRTGGRPEHEAAGGMVVQRDRGRRHVQGRGAGVGDGAERPPRPFDGASPLGGGQTYRDGHERLEGVERLVVPLAPGSVIDGRRRPAGEDRG